MSTSQGFGTWRPAVSTIMVSKPLSFAYVYAWRAISTGSISVPFSKTVVLVVFASVLSCSTAAGRYTSQATSKTLRGGSSSLQ